MKIGYYPGCTLKTKAKNLEDAAIKSMAALGYEMVELDRWNCCGAVYSLADDDLVHFLAPVRDLIRAHDQGFDKVVTLCSMCYNTLARANLLMRDDEVKRDALNDFMEEENDYKGEVEVVHLLNFIRDEIGWDKLRDAVKVPLEGLNFAPYYGCTLTRPEEVGIDSPKDPVVFQAFIEAIGGNIVDFPASQTCCGSYQIISNPEAAKATTLEILTSASDAKADALVLSCPLCEYNIGRRQDEIIKGNDKLENLPTFYFTQLLAIALGLPIEDLKLELNTNSTKAFLEQKGLPALA
ncbi:MAG: CoB--CoM heterodisulfide reductase iron-sulfur subunit B family protein [Candidatus Electryonea clarkiae]|nr:CoB--CoM heterodisulfide reductase iron-sulfur subunit B family protein [Candidatus Electryonea clarkiae]MDP8286136.1 CoB--CoM heterodisulfide reductase iron-sulfur subunit B family protein [Candidatus Electryonea clarkiae]